MDNKVLYEKIMRQISKEVKRVLNENLEYNSVETRKPRYRYVNEGYYPSPDRQDRYKMESYRRKGSDPNRLVKSITNPQKLVNRWAVAMNMNWKEAAEVFEEAIKSRRLMTSTEMDRTKERYNYE